MRRAAKVDGNHAAVVAALRRCGFAAHDTSRLGHGFPDLVVYRPSHGVMLVEIKDGSLPPSRRRLTSEEATFAARFPVRVISSVSDVVALAASPVGGWCED